MSLIEPTVGVDPGPDWASNLNSSLTIIDGHDHSSGKGVQITPSGLNISADLPINGNNLTLVRSTRFQPQVTPISGASDIGVVYESGVDLYYNDGNGVQIQITKNGGVAGTPGSIANLVPPASASYISGSGTFQFESGSNTAANIDAASYVLRNMTAGSFGVTLSPISSLSSNYTLTLPTLPLQQSFMTLDQSGNISAPWTVDNSTLAISGSNVIVKSGGITNVQIAANTILDSNIAANTIQQDSLYKAAFQSGSASAGNVGGAIVSGTLGTPSFTTLATFSLSTTSRPVQIVLGGSNGTHDLSLNYTLTSGGGAGEGAFLQLQILGSDGFNAITTYSMNTASSLGAYQAFTLLSNFLDTAAGTGTTTYTLQGRVGNLIGSGITSISATFSNFIIWAKEL